MLLASVYSDKSIHPKFFSSSTIAALSNPSPSDFLKYESCKVHTLNPLMHGLKYVQMLLNRWKGKTSVKGRLESSDCELKYYGKAHKEPTSPFFIFQVRKGQRSSNQPIRPTLQHILFNVYTVSLSLIIASEPGTSVLWITWFIINPSMSYLKLWPDFVLTHVSNNFVTYLCHKLPGPLLLTSKVPFCLSLNVVVCKYIFMQFLSLMKFKLLIIHLSIYLLSSAFYHWLSVM